MSILILSGALLALNPVGTVQPECSYPAYHALEQAKKGERFRSPIGLLKSPEPSCHSVSRAGNGNALDSYKAYIARYVPAPLSDTQLTIRDSEPAKPELVAAANDNVVSDEEKVLRSNDGDAGSSVFTVMNATIPTASSPPPVWKPLMTQQTGSRQFIFPLTTAPYVTSSWGLRYHPVIHSFMRHEGTDFRSAIGSEVMSIADGIVVESGFGPVTGFYITVQHADGWSSRYLHLSRLIAAKKQYVQKGMVIGLSGATGRTNGPHLHLEISHNNQLLDPMTLLFEQRTTSTQIAQTEPVVETRQDVPAPPPIDMTPAIAVISGSEENLQIGIRIGRKMAMYSPQEIVETDMGRWRIVKKFGKYKLDKIVKQ